MVDVYTACLHSIGSERMILVTLAAYCAQTTAAATSQDGRLTELSALGVAVA